MASNNVSAFVIGWQWLKMACRAKQALLAGDGSFGTEFYESKIHTMRFYFKYELSKMTSLAEVLVDEQSLTVDAFKAEVLG